MNGKCPLTPLEVCLYQILDCSLMILKLWCYFCSTFL
jgi:hypothetical protein